MSTSCNPTCRTGKIGFPHERAALRHASTMRQGRAGKRAPHTAYRCNDCGEFHLSSQSQRERRKRARSAWQHVGHHASDEEKESA